jgi:RNA polymerase sigma-70 factor (ECF subfamily)
VTKVDKIITSANPAAHISKVGMAGGGRGREGSTFRPQGRHLAVNREIVEPQTNLQNLSDEELLTLSFERPAVFGLIVDRYQEPFLRKIRGIIEPESRVINAEDVVQETFVKIYLKGRSFNPQPGASFKSWAYKILLNTCFTAYQKAKKERSRYIELDPEISELVADQDDTERERVLDTDFLLSIFSRLPNAMGKIADLYFIQGKSHKQIAELERVSVGAVRTRIHRARRAIEKISSSFNNSR